MRPLIMLWALIALATVVCAQSVPDTLWTREYPEFRNAGVNAVVPSFDGGLVLTGVQEFAPADTFALIPRDLIVIQTDARGEVQWTYRRASMLDTLWEGVTLCRTLDSAYVVLARKRYDDSVAVITLVKLNRRGEEIWLRDYRIQTFNFAHTLGLMADGSYLVGSNLQIVRPHERGCTNNLFVMDVSPDGDTVWTQTWRGAQCERLITSAITTSDGGCLLMGVDCPPRVPETNPLMIKLNGRGDVEWERLDDAQMDWARVCALEVADGYIIGRNYFSITQLEKVGLDGSTQWVQSYEVETERSEYPEAVVAAEDGGYLIAQLSQLRASERWAPILSKTDAAGNLQWRIIADLTTSNYAPGFCQTPWNTLVFAGWSGVPRGYTQPWYLWMEEYGWPTAKTTHQTVRPETFGLRPNYPNPFNPTTEIAFDLPRTSVVTLTVHNLLGQEVASLTHDVLSAGRHTVMFDGGALPSGVYLCRLQTAEGMQTRKMMLLK
ncbi:MAG TPA: T9SS type A sorting domain-containing protein [bacterium]